MLQAMSKRFLKPGRNLPSPAFKKYEAMSDCVLSWTTVREDFCNSMEPTALVAFQEGSFKFKISQENEDGRFGACKKACQRWWPWIPRPALWLHPRKSYRNLSAPAFYPEKRTHLSCRWLLGHWSKSFSLAGGRTVRIALFSEVAISTARSASEHASAFL